MNQNSLNSEQKKAVSHKNGPLLVLAGAGSGKTRVVTERIAYLISEGVSPNAICAVTFTNKAAGEMRERIAHLLRGSSHPTICTFHSLGVKILRESIHFLEYGNDFLIYDEEDSKKLLQGCIQSLGLAHDVQQFKLFRKWISETKNQRILPQDLADASKKTKDFQGLYELYAERLKAANAVDFDDLLFLTCNLFEKFPSVLEKYQERWPYLLIDEYQDTNKVQYLIAKYMVKKSRNLFVVGDPDQSIYSWRGANIQNILNFERDFPGASIIRLEQNYRSTQNILDAANALIRNNSNRFEKKLYSEKKQGDKLSFFLGYDEHEEAHFVVAQIQALKKNGFALNNICIFYRTNFQSRIFEDYLLRAKLPYLIVGGMSFYQRREIKDIFAFLRLVLSDNDLVSFERAIQIPKRGLGDASLSKLLLFSSENNIPILSACRAAVAKETDFSLTKKQITGLTEFLHILSDLRNNLQPADIQGIVTQTIQKSGYLDFLKEEKETFEDRKANIEELISKAYDFEKNHNEPTLANFLEELSLKGQIDDSDFASDQIHLMTLHNGKGLEFRAAFMVGMEEDLFPHINAKDSHDSIEEERRLCYVGITRAQEKLYLSQARNRYLWGFHREMHTSRFLKELPKELLFKV